MPVAVQAVLFDLGGVLAEQGVTGGMRDLAGLESEEHALERWLACTWARRFESGGCTASEFAAGIVDDWSLAISANEFLDVFRGWAIRPFPGAIDLVHATKALMRVGCLSNTNIVHWEDRVAAWGLADLFEFPLLSFQMNLVKPDREIFDLAVAAVGCDPQEILFLDDSSANVEAARDAGMKSAVVRGVSESRSVLQGFGVL